VLDFPGGYLLDRHATYIVAAYIAGAARWTGNPAPAPPGSLTAARRPAASTTPASHDPSTDRATRARSVSLIERSGA